ncbi:MAG: RagB/SusD family nutrient uptake outer membrane protein [Chitinophagaceae bacterium]|nr:MAG: RagB/SusD family nutrient uptake outer membrane protein [Chitinophagaceae bacterium]
MKKIIKYFPLVVGVIIFGSSCTKEEGVLNKKPLNILSSDVVWKDDALINAYLTECFAETYVFHNVSTDNSWSNLWTGSAGWAPMYIDQVSDECGTGYASDGYSYKMGQLKIQGGLLEWWENAYKVIRELNIFIENVPSSPLNANEKTELVAEARWLRAYNYFEMVERYGGVPLITHSQSLNDPKDSLYPKRSTEQSIYDFVISETDSIENQLPQTFSDVSRPNMYADLALKCRAALFAGSVAQYGTVQLNGIIGIDPSKAIYYYQQAYDAAQQIINGGQYTLYNKYPNDKVENFRELFTDKNGNPEVIFSVAHNNQNSMGNTGNGWAYDFFQCPLPNGWGSGNMDAPYLETAEWFEHVDGTSGKLDTNAIQQGLWTTNSLWANKDPRFYATIYTQNTPWKGGILDYHHGLITSDGSIITQGSYNGVLANGNQNWQNGTGFGVLKYLDENHNEAEGASSGQWASSSTNWIVFRYAEALLNYAEAAFYLGKTNDALGAINQIRQRAGIAPLTSINEGAIRQERKVELAFEGFRYWDLRRWRVAVDTLSVNRSGLTYILDYNTGKYKLQVIHNIDGTVTPPAFYSQNYYLPITLARTAADPNLVENPGYK